MKALGAIGVALAISLFGIVGSIDPAFAERRLALVIGNGDYAVGPLDNPTNDAALMAETLRQSGFEVTHVENLGYRDLQRAVVGFGRDLRGAGDDTVGMVYYAGHAVQADGENYLIPVDADIQDELDLQISTLRISTLMSSLDKAGNRMNMVVLDACRNNPFKAMSRSGSRGLAKIEAASGTLLAYSTAPGRVAADGTGRNSPYTAALVKAMRMPGLPVEQVFKRVRIEVMEKTAEQQVPWESSSLTGDFTFIAPAPVVAAPTPAPAPAAPDNSAEIAYWTSIATGNDPALFQGYLAAYPNGLFANLAQQRIAALQAAQAQAGERAARQSREAEARALWEAVQNSDDPALLQNIVDRYGDTVYAQLARVKLDGLAARQAQAAAAPAQAASNDNRAETLFWQSIRNSTNRADYQAYLDQYPDGTFAAIARDRAQSGYQPQVAALASPASAHPYDGDWLVTWKVIGGYYGGVSWCAAGEKGTTRITVKDGEWSGRFTSNYSGSARVTIKVAESGGGTFHAKVPGWSIGTAQNRFDLSTGSYEGPLEETGYCLSRLAFERP